MLAVSAQAQQRFVAKVDDLARFGIASKEVFPGWRSFSVSDTSVVMTVRNAGIYVEPDHKREIYSVNDPNDSLFQFQWGLTASNRLWRGDFREAWAITEGSSSVKIGIIDTGIPLKDGRWTHPDLDSFRVSGISFVDFGDSDRTVADYHGHQTHLIGIIGAKTNNKIGVAGIDKYCRIVGYKAFTKDGYGYDSWIANAIYRAVYDSCRVLCMSFGGSSFSRMLQDAMVYAYEHGIFCSISGGNSGGEDHSFPAFFGRFTTVDKYRTGLTNIFVVGAVDENGKLPSYTNRGWFIDGYAPGGAGGYPMNKSWNILSTLPTYSFTLGDTTRGYPYQSAYGYLAGTSMSNAFVVGTASLMLAVNPSLTPEQIRGTIIATMDRIVTVDGTILILNPGAAVWAAKSGMITSVSDKAGLPVRFTLHQNYPNPFNPMTTISYDVLNESHIRLVVYDIYGREVTMLVNETKPAGTHKVVWDASNIASGVYFYRLEAGGVVNAKKMLLLK